MTTDEQLDSVSFFHGHSVVMTSRVHWVCFRCCRSNLVWSSSGIVLHVLDGGKMCCGRQDDKVLVVGGGLSAAQAALLAVQRGAQKV